MLNLRNLTFDEWVRNHPHGHAEVWLREVFPWAVLAQVDFEPTSRGRTQKIVVHNTTYEAKLKDTTFQPNGRALALIHVRMNAPNKTGAGRPEMSPEQGIGEISWNNEFAVIYDPSSLDFITSFTKGKHPLEFMVERFMRGDLHGLSFPREGTALLVLARTLMSSVASRRYPRLDYLRKYLHIQGGVRDVKYVSTLHRYLGPGFPILSRDRRFWLMYAWDEAVAHRYGIWFADQCERMMVIYANPNRTRHHRCNARQVDVVSLDQFVDWLPDPDRRFYDRQLWLIREGNIPSSEPKRLGEIFQIPFSKQSEFIDAELREAHSVLDLDIKDSFDAVYVFSSFNLVNAWVNYIRDRPERKARNLFKELYSFKGRLAAALSKVIIRQVAGVDIFIDIQNWPQIAYVAVHGLQFSFKYPTLSGILLEYRKSDGACPTKGNYLLEYAQSSKNKPQAWTGTQLQPIASPILGWARRLRRENARKV